MLPTSCVPHGTLPTLFMLTLVTDSMASDTMAHFFACMQRLKLKFRLKCLWCCYCCHLIAVANGSMCPEPGISVMLWWLLEHHALHALAGSVV